MKLWIDLGNSPHVPFFVPLIAEFEQRGHTVELTARAFAQTVELSRAAGLEAAVIGSHGGRKLSGKAIKLLQRSFALARWALPQRFDLAISHNSHEQIVAARVLGVPIVTLMDYEHHPANHLSFRLASRVIVPNAFPAAALRRCGATQAKVRRYSGIKEDVYLADFCPQPDFAAVLSRLGVDSEDILVVARAPASFALYHRFKNELFDQLIDNVSATSGVKIILLARTEEQRRELGKRHTAENILLPAETFDGANLIAAADLVVSAGGTMNREAAALGVPAVTTFEGRWAAVDEALVREGRLKRIMSREDFKFVPLEKKEQSNPRRACGVKNQVVQLILDP
jgi:uncharacterized protein